MEKARGQVLRIFSQPIALAQDSSAHVSEDSVTVNLPATVNLPIRRQREPDQRRAARVSEPYSPTNARACKNGSALEQLLGYERSTNRNNASPTSFRKTEISKAETVK